jgi:hypothetical protein
MGCLIMTPLSQIVPNKPLNWLVNPGGSMMILPPRPPRAMRRSG